MAIKEEEQKKNGMKIVDNMDGEKSAEAKLNMAKVSYGKELDKLPGNSIQEKIENEIGHETAKKLSSEVQKLKLSSWILICFWRNMCEYAKNNENNIIFLGLK